MHFLLWIASLSCTGITSSIVSVTTSPIFVELYSMTVKGERTSARVWTGIGLAIVGGVVLGGGNLAAGGGNWRGDILATGGAIAVAGYFLVGGRLRPSLPLLGYVFPVYGSAALFLVLAAPFLGGGTVGLEGRTYLYTFLMALVCQLAGHSLLNWALRGSRTIVVTMSTLGEPVGTTILALLILGEVPLPHEIVGGAIMLAGVFVVIKGNPARVTV